MVTATFGCNKTLNMAAATVWPVVEWRGCTRGGSVAERLPHDAEEHVDLVECKGERRSEADGLRTSQARLLRRLAPMLSPPTPSTRRTPCRAERRRRHGGPVVEAFAKFRGLGLGDTWRTDTVRARHGLACAVPDRTATCQSARPSRLHSSLHQFGRDPPVLTISDSEPV